MNQPNQGWSDSAAMVEFLHQENDDRRRAVLSRSLELSSGRPFANHPGKNQPARSRAQLKVVGRDSGSPKATLRVWGRIFGTWAGFLVIFPKSSLYYCLHREKRWCRFAIGSLSDAVALCFAESPPEFMLNIVESKITCWALENYSWCLCLLRLCPLLRNYMKLWVLFCACLVACKEYWNSDSHSFYSELPKNSVETGYPGL